MYKPDPNILGKWIKIEELPRPAPKPEPAAVPVASAIVPAAPTAKPAAAPALPVVAKSVPPSNVRQTPVTPSDVAREAAVRDKNAEAFIYEMGAISIGVVFLVFDLMTFLFGTWDAAHPSPELKALVGFPVLWSADHAPNFLEVLYIVAKAVVAFLFEVCVFLLYLATRNFFTNVGLWVLLYVTVRLLIRHLNSEPEWPIFFSSAPAGPTVDTQNAFGDAAFASPAAIAQSFANRGGVDEFFED